MSPLLLLLAGWIALVAALQWLQARFRRQFAGCTIGLLQVRLQTTRFNAGLARAAWAAPGLWRLWYSVGSWVGVCLLVLAPLVLAVNLLQGVIALVQAVAGDGSGRPSLDQGLAGATDNASVSSVQPAGGLGGDGTVLRPILPGVTVPLVHALYFFVTLLLNGVLHEMAHGLAAVVEGVRIESCGFFLTVAYPGAFVELNTQQLEATRPGARLRIFSAGVFHNVVICLVSAAALAALPATLSLFYAADSGVAVSAVSPYSALSGSLEVGSTIEAVGCCETPNLLRWDRCLYLLKAEYEAGRTGICLQQRLIHQRSTATQVWTEDGVLQCCGPQGPRGEARLCFARPGANASHGLEAVSCLSARAALTSFTARCKLDTDCPDHSVCMVATEEEPNGRLLALELRHAKPILYFGPIEELGWGLKVSRYTGGGAGGPDWPEIWETLLRYLTSISGAFAVLNMVPCASMDGQHAALCALELLGLHGTRRDSIADAIFVTSYCLLAFNLALAALQMLTAPAAPT